MLKSFSDTVKSHRVYESRRAPESAGDVESTVEDDEDRCEISELFLKEDPPSHGSLKEMLTEISLVDLGKQLTSAQLNDQLDEFTSIMRTFEHAWSLVNNDEEKYDMYLAGIRQALQDFEAAKQSELPDHLK